MILNLITPCANPNDLWSTYRSIKESKLTRSCKVRWIIIHNAGSNERIEFPKCSFDIEQYVLPKIASASLSRNYALDLLSGSTAKNSWVLFLDSGDLMHHNFEFLPTHNHELVHYRYCVKDHTGCIILKNNRYPQKLLRNPFYLGSVAVRLDFIGSTRFEDGRKEDWKFWLEILSRHPKIYKSELVSYVYTVKSNAHHAFRKSKLIKDQYFFYHRFLNCSVAVSILLTILHYVNASFDWSYRAAIMFLQVRK